MPLLCFLISVVFFCLKTSCYYMVLQMIGQVQIYIEEDLKYMKQIICIEPQLDMLWISPFYFLSVTYPKSDRFQLASILKLTCFTIVQLTITALSHVERKLPFFMPLLLVSYCYIYCYMLFSNLPFYLNFHDPFCDVVPYTGCYFLKN